MIENVRKEAVEEEEEGEHGAKQSWFSLIQKVFLSPSISQEKKYRKKLWTVFLDLTHTKGSGSCEFWQICSLFFALLLTNNPSTHSNTSDTQNVHTHFTSSTMLVKISQTQRSWENTKTFFSLASNYNTLKTSGFGGSEQGSGRSWREER